MLYIKDGYKVLILFLLIGGVCVFFGECRLDFNCVIILVLVLVFRGIGDFVFFFWSVELLCENFDFFEVMLLFGSLWYYMEWFLGKREREKDVGLVFNCFSF